MTISLQALNDGSAKLLVNGAERLTINADGTLQGFVSPTAADINTKKLPTMDLFGVSLSSNGWQKLPSGLIIQWGAATPNPSGVNVTYPLAFPSAVLAVLTSNSTQNLNVALGYNAGSPTSFAFFSSSTGQPHQWFAIGV